MDKRKVTDIEELREKLRHYYGTAAMVMGDGDPFHFMPAFCDMMRVDDLSEEEIIEKAERLGII
ncbi:MAG: hypothetical protein IKS51_00405 [Erysipelotrichaceae bacterium]|nr:hypothetical protein [Erysipelotrichaceae bacterium]